MNPAGLYQEQIYIQQQELALLKRRRKQIAWTRFFLFILTIAISAEVFITYGGLGAVPLVLGLAILLYFVSRDVDNNRNIRHKERLISLHQLELRILDLDLKDERDNGAAYLPQEHDYAHDMDILGPFSIFHWLNRASTEGGRKHLAHNLLYPATADTIRQRQEAVNELQSQLEWRQNFLARGLETVITQHTRDRLQAWETQEPVHMAAWTGAAVWIYSIGTIALMVLSALDIIPPIFSAVYPLLIIVSLVWGRNAAKPYFSLAKIADEISVLAALMTELGKVKGQSPLIRQLTAGADAAQNGLNRLKSILNAFDNGFNLLGITVLNPFLLWNVRQTLALSRWQQKHQHSFRQWFDQLEEMELLLSLAALHTNNPGWAQPVIHSNFFELKATELGHPLIHPSKNVHNNIGMQGKPELLLITGSNMAGKSTFLRSLGVNTVLAQMGSRVCATEFSLSPCQLVSSMRIADNLAENTSTFYAELRKLKQIIEYVNEKRPVFVLLDEILRGTNSNDRHTGTAALIEQFIRQDAVVVLATHDLQLASLENRYPGVLKNYHFDVQVEGDELYFDYKFKPGVCRSLNASILMKKIGIEMPA